MRTKTPFMADRILRAAGELFATQHFHEVRMDDIALRADVGKGTLYRYFSDKDELYLALVGRASKELLQRMTDGLGRCREPKVQLQTAIAAILDFFDERPHLFDLIQRAEVLQGPGFVWRETRQQLIETMTNLFQKLQAQGGFAIADPTLSALLLLGGLRTVIRFGKRPRSVDLPAQVLNVFLQVSNGAANSSGSARRSQRRHYGASLIHK
jgi:AcrR family transcriptional regulator